MKNTIKVTATCLLLFILTTISVFAYCRPGIGSLDLLIGTILPYDNEGCKAETTFTGCYYPDLLDNKISVSASYKYRDSQNNIVTLSDSEVKYDAYEVDVRIEGPNDNGISATSNHYAKCYYCDGTPYSETLSESY